jgi:tripartite-type tricarboxylate transporter receptor subunit TctC
MPASIRRDIEKTVITALNDPDAKARLRAAGIEVTADGAAELQKRIANETVLWRDVIGKADIKAQ